MSLSELDTLRRLSRHRADRAERALGEAKRAQAALLAQVEQARGALAQTRLDEARQSAELARQHQGQVLSMQALKAWGTQERTLLAGTVREEGQLQVLCTQQTDQLPQIEEAQKHVSQCLRDVEKLKELCALLAEESP